MKRRLDQAYRLLRIVAAGGLAILALSGWVDLVGPQVHVVETIIGLLLAFGVFAGTLYATRRARKKRDCDKERKSGER